MIKGFMHVYATDRGARIFRQQIERLKRTGLWDATDKIYICSVGPVADIPDDPKIVHRHYDNHEEFERPTLAALYEQAKGDDCRMWYIHTKGASWQCDDHRYRLHMESVVIDDWKTCVRALDVARTCGPLGMNNPEPVYAGNFWWIRSDYARTLIEPYEWAANTVLRGGNARHSCETWCIQNQYVKHLFLTLAEQHLPRWAEPERAVNWHYRSYQEIVGDVHGWCERLPPIAAVAGIPKSGCLIATLISHFRNIPLLSIDALIQGQLSYRRDGRIQRKVDGPILIVDDTSASGSSMKDVRLILRSMGVDINMLFGALYAIPNESIDLYGYELTTGYHTFESNFLRDCLSQNYVCDLDGVFRKDWKGSNEDLEEEHYRGFLRSGPPTHLLPTYPVMAIVSASLGKYRHLTEDWLHDHGVQYGELILPYETLADRAGQNIAAAKAAVYMRLAEATLFVESEMGQAMEIKRITGRAVFCTDNMTMLQ
jgi:hypothetical protein